MAKRDSVQLRLNRETLRDLDEDQLRAADGGVVNSVSGPSAILTLCFRGPSIHSSCC
ncbi:MAG TPA: hypothetical protein VG245_06385 [Candidatus Dormibacteraeota bacterium]|jgi:hypothetical protein|nr:hypothetical protein [Candidatus Dormibacteraeota bacterium]